ncbi:hypothetical protein BaRGS_00008422, partial [Batillaria attramentaria]
PNMAVTCTAILALLPWAVVTWSAAHAQPVVQLGNSSVYGLEEQVGNSTVWKFLGIRFARPPTGPLRFSKPHPATLPEGTVNATSYGPACLALPVPLIALVVPSDEDCLFLNVFVPRITDNSSDSDNRSSGDGEVVESLPVMVWIYGGAFVFGSTQVHPGQVLAAEGEVIVVTVNYRLGALGFLSTGDNSSRGNYGLWDQQLALKWVKDNIRHFGGDDTRITLFGESAGAVSVGYHTVSTHSASLFHRAILQSGTHTAPWGRVWGDPLDIAFRLARAVGCAPADTTTSSVSTETLVACLRGKPVSDIVIASNNVSYTNNAADDFFNFVWLPVEDGDFIAPDNDDDNTFHGEIMAGVTNYEGGFLAVELPRQAVGHPDLEIKEREYFRDSLLPSLVRKAFRDIAAHAQPEHVEKAADLLDCTYRHYGSNSTYTAERDLEELTGDYAFYHNTVLYMDNKPTLKPGYLYYFNHYPAGAFNGDRGVMHGLDVPFTFGLPQDMLDEYGYTSVDHVDVKLSADWMTLLTNFAKTG